MRHLLVLIPALALAAAPALAEDSVGHASAAVNDSAEAVAHLAAAGVQTVGGVLALPIGAAGAASEATGAIAKTGGESVGAMGVDAQKGAKQMLVDSWGPLSVDNRVVVRADPAPKVPYTAQRTLGR